MYLIYPSYGNPNEAPTLEIGWSKVLENMRAMEFRLENRPWAESHSRKIASGYLT